MRWIGLHVPCEGELMEIVLAELSQLPFVTFEEKEDHLSAYCDEGSWDEKAVNTILVKYGITDYRKEEIDRINWNEEWEKNYEPIEVGSQLMVRAPFHPPSGRPLDLVIQPKMSFGTGHHATTHLVMEYQLQIDHLRKKVLDVGCGTGVLAILARKLGANPVIAIDIGDWCVENSLENFALNGCEDIEVSQAEIQSLSDRDFDLILANITKGVHQELMKEYVERMKKSGLLIMSGFFLEDVDEIKSIAQKAGLVEIERGSRNGWARLVCQKL